MRPIRTFFGRRSLPTRVIAGLAILVLVGLVDHLTAEEMSFSIFYLIPVLLVSWEAPRSYAILFSLLSAFTWLFVESISGVYKLRPLSALWNAGVRFSFFYLVARLILSLRTHYEREIRAASDVQRHLLPQAIPAISGLEIAFDSVPTKVLSGDYFDIIAIDDRHVGFCVADVCGHGIPAAILMANFQSVVRLFCRTPSSPSDLCAELDAVMRARLPDGKFISFFFGILDTDTKQLAYSNAGHVPPAHVRNDGSYSLLDVGGPILGVIHDPHWDCAETTLSPGDRLVFVTDGIIEAANDAQDQFGLDRLTSLATTHRTATAQVLVDTIIKEVGTFSNDDVSDDRTAMVIAAYGFIPGHRNHGRAL